MNNKSMAAAVLIAAALACTAARAEDASNNREIHDGRSVTQVDPPGRNYQRPMTPEQKKQQLAYEKSRRCYARFATKRGGLKPGAEKTCGPALKDPSANP